MEATGRAVPDLHQGAAEAGAVAPDARPVFAVEILGEGQQYVCEGIHPKTGRAYAWRDGKGPDHYGADGLTEITAEQIDAWLERIGELVTEAGYEIVSAGGAGAEGGSRAGVWQDGLRAPSLAAVEEALAAIPNDLDYDGWFNVMAAVKAATEGLEA